MLLFEEAVIGTMKICADCSIVKVLTPSNQAPRGETSTSLAIACSTGLSTSELQVVDDQSDKETHS